MRKLIVSVLIMLGIALFLALPTKSSFIVRNTLGDAALRGGSPGVARFLYTSTAIQNSFRGRNNLIALDFFERKQVKFRSADERLADRRAAEAAFEELADQGYAPAQYNLALFYYRCDPSKPGYQYTLKGFERAIQLGDERARLAYALHLSGRIKENRPLRRELLKELADEGDPLAAARYADLLRSDGPERDAEVTDYFEIAAQGGILQAQERLGRDNHPERRKWLVKAIDQGSVPAALWLGELYETGDSAIGGEVNKNKAAKYYQKAIDLARTPKVLPRRMEIVSSGLRFQQLDTNRRASVLTAPHKAAYQLGLMQMRGDGIEQDMEAARESFEFAAAAAHKDSGVIAALFQYDDRPKYTVAHSRRVLGFETINHWGRDEFEQLTPELRQLIETGELRALTRLDIERWQNKSDNPNIDISAINELSNAPDFENALVAMNSDPELPAQTAWGRSLKIILPYSNSDVSGPRSQYEFIAIDRRAKYSYQ